MMSAVSAAQAGASTMLLDKNEKLGKKVFITGHGRCNVTNASDRENYEKKTFRNPRFMRSALSKFGPDDLIDFLNECRVPTKQEESGRIFPASDKSSDIIRAFRKKLENLGVEVELNTAVKSIDRKDSGIFVVRTTECALSARAVVLATGGASYPSTGSTGEGIRFAEKLGHSVESFSPGLVGLSAKEPKRELAGLTLHEAQLSVYSGDRLVATEVGDVLFTHFGISGPAAFRASCILAGAPAGGALAAKVNLSGKRTREELIGWLTDRASAQSNSEVKTLLSDLVPRRTVPFVMDAARVPEKKKANQLTREERTRLADTIASFSVALSGTRPLEEAIISIGGVSTKQIVPSTMASRIVPGLFFAGEIIDVSAYTGGYNLQIAFSSGRLAGTSAADYALGEAKKQ